MNMTFFSVNERGVYGLFFVRSASAYMRVQPTRTYLASCSAIIFSVAIERGELKF